MYTAKNIEPLTDFTPLQKDFFLLVFSPQAIPPHIALMHNFLLYDINVKGKKLGKPMTTLSLSKTPLLAFKIDMVVSAQELKNTFKAFEKVAIGVSCLQPILKFFQQKLPLNFNDVKFVFDLLPVLEKAGLIKQVYGYNVPLSNKNSFQMPKYTQTEINNRVQALTETLC